jgi:hypothetical protein
VVYSWRQDQRVWVGKTERPKEKGGNEMEKERKEKKRRKKNR